VKASPKFGKTGLNTILDKKSELRPEMGLVAARILIG